MVNVDTNSAKMLSETDIIKILEFLIDNIIVMSDGMFFNRVMGTNYDLLTDLLP
jgi:hypothetical protein